MTSEERRQRRYERRKARREAKRRIAIAEYDNFDNLCSMNALFRAAKLSRKTIRWKESVQRYFLNWLRNLLLLRFLLLNGRDVTMGFICFTLCERGKTRSIRSVRFKERVPQRSLCDNALVPVLRRSLIYDNGASLEGKGITFTLHRLHVHLHRYFRENGSNEGWILLIDFTGYFDNILHEPIYAMLERAFDDKRIAALTRQFAEPFGEKSLGIGSQVSQILAVSYRSPIDHFIKEVLRERYYGCYMDDSYIISSSKERLQYCLAAITAECEKLGIKLNPKKTQIVKVSHGFTFMKGRYWLTETGKVVAKPCHANTVRERRKLKKFRKLLDRGEMTIEQIACSYNSYRGYILREYDGHTTIRNMDKLFHELFGYDVKIYREEKF